MSAMELVAEGRSPQEVTKLSILGTTGSIGCSAIDVIQHQAERFDVVALVGNQNIELLAQQAIAVNAEVAVTADEARYQDLKDALAGSGVSVAAGQEAVLALLSVTLTESDAVLAPAAVKSTEWV